jgi:hypothetical protein
MRKHIFLKRDVDGNAPLDVDPASSCCPVAVQYMPMISAVCRSIVR